MAERPAKALIFDMDGTIVDNMRFHDDAWDRFYQAQGKPFDRASFSARTAGMAFAEIVAPDFPDADEAAVARMAEEKEGAYRELYRPHLTPVPGLLPLMARAATHGVPMAVASAAPPDNIDFILDGLEIRPFFATLVSPSQGFRGKPHPDMFLAAAERMGVAPDDCLVFEDALNGVEAARRAGMRAVALTTMLEAEAFARFDNLIASAGDFTALDRLPALRFA